MWNARYLTGAALLATAACATPEQEETTAGGQVAQVAQAGQAAVKDDQSQPDIVKVAAGSQDHTTLVAALAAADLVNALANAGPFTVFAPTNAGFEKLPAGAVDDLMKPANRGKLRDVLMHHVTTSAQDLASFSDGQVVSMADGTTETVSRKGADVLIGSAKVLASVRASNGWVHVIDAVLVPSR